MRPILALMGLLTAILVAGHAPATDSSQVVTTFAVPVGVPVANLSSGYYSYGQTYQQQYAPQQTQAAVDEALIEKIVERVLQRMGNQQNTTQVVQPQAHLSLVQTHCSKCHVGEEAKGAFSIEGMDDSQRLHAIRMVLADDPTQRMPKNANIDADVRGLIIQELASTTDPGGR